MSVHPHTPQSPSQLSPSTADQLSNMNSSMSSHPTTNTLPTPAHSVSGQSNIDPSQDVVMADDFSRKRKRAPDMESNEQKKVQVEDPRRLGIDNLHLDVGEKYFLCRTPLAPTFPRVTSDLFDMFGLAGIASEVARVKPNGEKNALRKTYKGHMKTLGINGHFDAVKKDENDGDSFLAMALAPEEEWHVCEVHGREIERGFSDKAKSSLLQATTMAKGNVPNAEWDSSVLGDLAPVAVSKKIVQDKPAKATPGTPRADSQQLQGGQMKNRLGKKRSYQDSSFDSYGDEDSAAESDPSQLKRRKQNLPSSLGSGARAASNGISA